MGILSSRIKENSRSLEEKESDINKLKLRIKTSRLIPYCALENKYFENHVEEHECVCHLCASKCFTQNNIPPNIIDDIIFQNGAKINEVSPHLSYSDKNSKPASPYLLHRPQTNELVLYICIYIYIYINCYVI